jgi:hypothetical protein
VVTPEPGPLLWLTHQKKASCPHCAFRTSLSYLTPRYDLVWLLLLPVFQKFLSLPGLPPLLKFLYPPLFIYIVIPVAFGNKEE